MRSLGFEAREAQTQDKTKIHADIVKGVQRLKRRQQQTGKTERDGRGDLSKVLASESTKEAISILSGKQLLTSAQTRRDPAPYQASCLVDWACVRASRKE
jgi:hypothetical protein